MHDDMHTRRSEAPDFANEDGDSLGLDEGGIAALRADIARWRGTTLADAEKRMAPRRDSFTTWSGLRVPDLVTPADRTVDHQRDLGLPGEYPFTRGVQPNMYRGKLWTMRMFAGFGT